MCHNFVWIHVVMQDREEKEKQMSAKASVEEIQDGLNNEEIIELQDLRSAIFLFFYTSVFKGVVWSLTIRKRSGFSTLWTVHDRVAGIRTVSAVLTNKRLPILHNIAF